MKTEVIPFEFGNCGHREKYGSRARRRNDEPIHQGRERESSREKSKEDIKFKACFVIIRKGNSPTSTAEIPPNPPEMKDFAELVVCFCCGCGTVLCSSDAEDPSAERAILSVSIEPIRYICILVTYFGFPRSADRVQKEKVRSKREDGCRLGVPATVKFRTLG